MRILNRPMFRYGGPINEGVMHGMRSNYAGGQRVGAFNVGSPVKGMFPKDVTGREHHVAPAVGAGLWYGAQGLARVLPWAMRGLRAGWKYMKPTSIPRNIVTKSKSTLPIGMRGTMGSRTTTVPRSNWQMSKEWMKANPGYTATGALSAYNAPGTYGAVKGAGGLGWKALKQAADLAVPDWIWDQDKWEKERAEKNKPPTDITKPGGFEGIPSEVKIKTKTPAEIAAEAKAARTAKLEKYMDTMGYDKAKKTALGDALIDASAIVQDATTEAGSLKKADWGKMINKMIQTTSKRLDKPEQIREAIGLMMTKADIEKDMTSSAHYKTAVDMVNTGAAKDITEAMKLLTNKKLNFEETVGSLSAKKDVTGKVLADAWKISGEGIPTGQVSGSNTHYKDFKEKMEDAKKGNIELEYVNVMIEDKQPGDIYIIDDRMVEVQPDGTTKYRW